MEQANKISEEVAERLSLNREAVIADFLSLEPLLQRTNLKTSLQSDERENKPSVSKEIPILNLPDFSVDSTSNVSEKDFVDRFVNHVENCGFDYDREDLLAFHISAKEQSPIILGGTSGTGKSSLPVLYAESLAGDRESDFDFYLPVDVNPSWTNPSDLLGYMDAFEHRFIPASSGMFRQMTTAQHAHRNLGPDAPIFIVCLEELNLAQPEHYLADIIQAISRSPGKQFINVFDENAVKNDDQFKSFAHLEIVPNLILVGTVNFDETTRPISKRLLDRCNLIEFKVNDHLPIQNNLEARTGIAAVKGPPVLQADRKRWSNRDSNIEPEVIDILDQIYPILNTLGCNLTHRRQKLIYRFIANSNGLCKNIEALDMQLLQRIYPQIRRLYRPGALDALDELIKKLEHKDVPRTLKALRVLREEERAASTLVFGEE
ncbi:MAG: hypothetical protein F4166_07795 [Gammaproteobacteria bacterium]|nr:hypothetical protein [Gammaproteobacteria bacterium]